MGLPCLASYRLVPYDPATMSFPVTVEQSMAAARQWAGQPALSFELRGVLRNEARFQTDYYVLRSADMQQFQISCYTAHVRWWNDLNAMDAQQERINRGEPNPGLLTHQELVQIATAFARGHYSNFEGLNMQLVEAEGGDIAFATSIPGGGFFSGNQCHIRLDPSTGEVWRYVAHFTGPISVPVQPTLTTAQVEGTALASFGGHRNVSSAFTYAPSELHVVADALDQQRLVWVVEAMSSPDPNSTFAVWQETGGSRMTAWEVYVDAHNGAVVRRDAYLGAPAATRSSSGAWRSRSARFKAPQRRLAARARLAPATPARPAAVSVDGREIGGLAYPPIAREGEIYWYAGYLKSPLWKMRVRREGRRVIVTSATGSRVVLRDGSRVMRVGTQTVMAGRAPVVIRGRTYLPLSTWERITGSRFQWSQRKRTVQIRHPTSVTRP